MSRSNRRTFLKHAGLGIAGTTTMGLARSASAGQANGKLVVGAIGCGGRGTYLARWFAGEKDSTVAYVCDPDAARAGKAAEAVAKAGGNSPKVVKDLRHILDDKAVDAVTVGTPDHWHGPATILACQAGKHVYVEKPVSHNVREGRLMVEAARRHKRIVQAGTHSRSLAHVIRGIELIRSGAIGDVLVAKAWNSQRRANIGHADPSKPPAGFDYDLWVGPAPFRPYRKTCHHYTWHWWYDFGTGDIGNDGVHELDIARWGLGVETHPSTVAAVGGKYFFDDDQQFPDTHYVAYEYPGDGKVGSKRQLVFEQRIWSPYVQEGMENGNAFYGTKGVLLLGKKEGWQCFGPRNKLVKQMKAGEPDAPPHPRRFMDAIKTGKLPNADIEVGHLSAALCHLGNISARLGRSLRFDPKSEQIQGDDEAAHLLRRTYRDGHWAVPKGA